MAREIIDNGESGLSARTKINNMFEELYGRTTIKESDVEWYVRELADLKNYQSLINTADGKKYERCNYLIFMQAIDAAPTFKITVYEPDTFEQGNENAIQISGTNLTGITISDIINNSELTIENVNLTVTDDNNAVLSFDNPDTTEENESITFIITKGLYSWEMIVMLTAPHTLEIIDCPGQVEKGSSVEVVIVLNQNVDGVEEVEGNNDIVINDFSSSDGDPGTVITIDANTTDVEEGFNLRVTADGMTTEWSETIYVSQPLTITEVPETVEIAEGIEINILINKDIAELENVTVESEATVNILEFGYSGEMNISLSLNTSEMLDGETFQLKVFADEEESEWSSSITATA